MVKKTTQARNLATLITNYQQELFCIYKNLFDSMKMWEQYYINLHLGIEYNQ